MTGKQPAIAFIARSLRWISPRKALTHVLFAALLTFAALQPTRAADAEQVAVITYPDAQVAEVDPNLLRGFFTLRVNRWPDGTPVRIFVLPDDHPTHRRFVRKFLGTYPYVLRGTWEQILFTGTGITPVVVSSEEMMRQRVANTRGAIGYSSQPVGGGEEIAGLYSNEGRVGHDNDDR